MLELKSLLIALVVLSTLIHFALVGVVGASWEDEWQKTVKAAELEGEAVFYSLAEIGDVFVKGGFHATRGRFFYHNRELGPEFLRRLFSEMELTLYRRYPQGEDWLATGKFALCLCRHQSISEAKNQGLPVDLVEPSRFKEGVGLETRAKTLVLMNKAPHPNAAKVFINWFLSREGQIDLQKTSGGIVDAGSEASLRIDIPKDDIPPRNRLDPGVKYFPQWNPDFYDMKPITKVITAARAEGERK